MATKCKIAEKSDKQIKLTTPDGKAVYVGYKKNAILLMKLSALEVGAEIDLELKNSDITQGYSGNLFVDTSDTFMNKMLDVREYVIRERQLAKQLAELDA